jgi:hypothetical protein
LWGELLLHRQHKEQQKQQQQQHLLGMHQLLSGLAHQRGAAAAAAAGLSAVVSLPLSCRLCCSLLSMEALAGTFLFDRQSTGSMGASALFMRY